MTMHDQPTREFAHPTRRLLLAGMAALGLPTGLRAEAAWPSRTVRLKTLAAAGAGTDAVARSLAEVLARRWGQPVIVENLPGANGILSIEAFLQSGDGHTLLFNPTGTWTTLHLMHERLSFDPPRDMLPLSFVAQDFLGIAVSPRLGIATLADLVAAARQRSTPLTYASVPSVPYLAFAAFQREAEIQLTFVPYRNPIASIPDVAEGRVDVTFLPLQPMLGPAAAGQIRVIAMASPSRAPTASDVPTTTEAGYPVLSFVGGPGVFARREMPETLRERIARDVREALSEPELGRRLSAMGYIPRGDTPQAFEAMLLQERARWTEVVRRHGVKPL